MGAQQEKAAMISGPLITANASGTLTADPTNLTGVVRVAVTGSAQALTLPAESAHPQKKSTLGKRFLRVLAMGCNVQLAQGCGAAPVPVLNQASAFGTGHVAAAATFVNGVADQWEIDPRATHIGLIGDGTGFIEFYCSDGPGRP